MTIDQIMIKLEGIKKNKEHFYKCSLSLTTALSKGLKAIDTLSALKQGKQDCFEEALKENLSKNAYDDYLEAKETILKRGNTTAHHILMFNLAYLLQEVVSDINEGFVVGVSHIIRLTEAIDKVKVNELVKKYKEEQENQTKAHSIQQALIDCGNFLATKEGAEEVIASLYVLHFYVLKIVLDIRKELANNIDDMLDQALQQVIDAHNELD